MYIKCPCKDCKPPIRHEACHDICPAYLEWKQKQESLKREYDEITSYKASKSLDYKKQHNKRSPKALKRERY